MRTPALAAAALAALGAACNTGFEPQYLVRDMRILAVRVQVVGTAATADASPGDTIFLEALIVNPKGRPGLQVTWYGCPPTASEELLPCADPAFLSDPGQIRAEANAANPRVIALGTCAPQAGGDRCGVTYTIPAAGAEPVAGALAFVVGIAEAEPAFRCRLYTEMPIVAIAEAGGAARQLALKRVRITPRPETLSPTLQGLYVVNLNPAAQDIARAAPGPDGCDGGVPLADPFPSGDSVLCGVGATSTQEFYTCGAGGPIEPPEPEEASWQWYATAGEFPEFGEGIGNASGGSIDFRRPPGPFTVWAILRDGRGGEDWIRRDLAPLP